MAQYANCGDENSQAEGTQNTHRRSSTNNQNNTIRNPHYENIYESIDQFATVNAPAPAENIPQSAATSAANNNNNNSGRINLRNRNNFHNNAIQHQRNMVGYDVPRHARNYYASNVNTASRRATLEANPNRIRYGNRAMRQRSFDDTESYHYSHNNFRYENIYEQIREEPIYRNMGLNRDNANRLYGRLDVIGHGIGRIERHLSSSCGNIDHYNLGGTYAILGHSHLSTVGYASNNPKENAGKSLNFFSCLGRENSQSMSNICRESSNGNATTEAATGATAAAQPAQTNENTNKHTGAIPKIKSKVQNTMRTAPNSNPNPIHSTALNRISKSSLQWLLMNKWLPLWVGNGPDCNVLDFFMFSRNCDGCERDDNVIVYDESNGAAYANNYRDFAHNNYYTNTVSRPARYNNSLMRFNERNSNRMYDRRANYRPNESDNSGYEMNEYNFRGNQQPENPFRRWELNSENNSFRPASVRRITDGTFPNGNNQHQNQRIRIEVDAEASGSGTASSSGTPLVTRATTSSANDHAVASTSRSASHSADASTSSAKLRPDRRAFENAALSSSTESAETESKILSPDLSARRYSENTEDDQYNNSGNSSSTDDEGNDETISELNTNDTDNSERINEHSS